MSQQVIWSDEGIAAFIKAIRGFTCSRLLMVVDAGAYELSGAKKILSPLLSEYELVHVYVNHRLPETSILDSVFNSYPITESDGILAVGGGMTIDIAKLIRLFGRKAVLDWKKADSLGEENALNIPLFVMPTTSGSGSEATHFAVLYIEGQKRSFAHPSMLPQVVYLDPGLTETLPVLQRAASGLDALAQGIESFWAVGSSEISRHFSEEAVIHAWKHLPRHIRQPDRETRRAMSYASHMAGRAINLAKTTACHALSYTMTSKFAVPHGIAVALTLAPMFVYNAAVSKTDVNDPRGVSFVQMTMDRLYNMLGCSTAEEAMSKIQQLLEDILGGYRLQHFGIESNEAVNEIVESVNLERLSNNPRALRKEHLIELLNDIR